jgi:CubicO group peptidase (beta-lactamase class C family)
VVIVFVVLCFYSTLVVPSRASEEITGHWEGAIQLPNLELGLLVDFSRSNDGVYTGEIDIPLQSAQDLPLSDISFDGRTVKFKIAGIPGDPAFDGALSEDGGTISGSFTQGGQQMTFSLERGAAPATTTRSDPFEGFDAFVEQARETWKYPGVAVAVIRDGEVIRAEGYGSRDVENELPVTENTMFAIGSSSKAFTATLLGMLVDEGKLDWDEPLRTYLPEFELDDGFADSLICARDLVTHRTGLPRHDLSWYGSDATRMELVRRVAHLEPSREFRDRFQYQNLMFVTAGYLAGRIEGSTWEALIAERILEPLGMRTTNLSVSELEKIDNRALGYKNDKDDDGKERIEVMPYRPIDAVGPAGSINSNVVEMARWVLLHLNNGEHEGNRLVSENTMKTMHTPQIVVPPESLIHRLSVHDEMPHLMYGMGWFIQNYRGHEMVHHGGNIDGFSALVSFMPREGIGTVVLTNLNGTMLPQVLTLNLYDRLLGLDEIDWNGRLHYVYTSLVAAQELAKKADAGRQEGTTPGHDLQAYAGSYENSGYGTLRVDLEAERLALDYNALEGPLEHWHYEVFNVSEGSAESTKLTFSTNVRGDVDAVLVPFEASVEAIRFERRPPARLSDPAFLRGLVGDYDLSGVTCEVRLRGEKSLTVTVPGQPTYTLDPYRRTEFDLHGVTGYSVRFTVEDGKGTKLVFIQPNGLFEASRKE